MGKVFQEYLYFLGIWKINFLNKKSFILIFFMLNLTSYFEIIYLIEV
jgi:hypothetical protein